MKENKFGLILKGIRQDMNLSQEEMAIRLNTTKQVLSRYETGKRIPKISTVAEYAEKLNLPIEIFWGEKTNGRFQTNKYENITTLLDQLNQKGIDEAKRHTKYLTTQDEYKKNNTKSSTKTIKLKTAEEITSSRLAAFGGMVEDENLRQKLIAQAEKQRQENKPE